MIVMKFGGSSVADRSQIEKVLGIVRSRLVAEPVVVSSAHKGITDGLIDAAKRASRGEAAGEDVLDRQQAILTSLDCPEDLLVPLYAEIRDLLRGIRLVRELSRRSLDYISSFGERMSVRCIADFFSREGVPTKAFDAWEIGFITDEAFNRARPLAGFEAKMRHAFARLVPAGTVPLVTGFIGKSVQGEITTLGRNGSDLTATLIGAALGAAEVQIWSDTDGVMTADPRIVPNAMSIPAMAFDEAAELAYFGSRVLHPATLVPAIENNIAVRVLNTNRPDHPGTVITSNPPSSGKTFTSIAYKERQSVLTITEPKMFEQMGFLAKVFTVLAGHQSVIDMVTTSEVSVSVTCNDVSALRAAIPDLKRFGEVKIAEDRSILAVVGRSILNTPGIGARVLQAMAKASVNIEMHSFAMGSNNISLVIKDQDVKRAVPALHDELFRQPIG